MLLKRRNGTQSQGLTWADTTADPGDDRYWEAYVDGVELSVVLHREDRRTVVFPPVWKGWKPTRMIVNAFACRTFIRGARVLATIRGSGSWLFSRFPQGDAANVANDIVRGLCDSDPRRQDWLATGSQEAAQQLGFQWPPNRTQN